MVLTLILKMTYDVTKSAIVNFVEKYNGIYYSGYLRDSLVVSGRCEENIFMILSKLYKTIPVLTVTL